ncbi:MAG TPA: amidase [Steroidobacteraceae bacterium]|jgi:Asp-tRNA(Asn)/Glu-tRNA(Gln) amidotransferase A subunit family amidase
MNDQVARRALLQGSALALIAGLAGRTEAAEPPAKPPPSPLEADLAAAERVLGLAYTPAERAQLARGYDQVLSQLGSIRKLELANDVSPACRFDPRLPGKRYVGPTPRIRGRVPDAGVLPSGAADIALAPAWKLGQWLRKKAISSVELTSLYLDRIVRLAPKLENFISVTGDLALAQAQAADVGLARGRILSPLHGVPYGMKDLFDVAGVRTTWGAEPYANLPAPQEDAAVVAKLRAAGAVLLGKTAVGALAYGDIWQGGRSRNPWNPEEGSSGSSAGSASATAAGLVGFGIGTETLGSIISPSHRCGTAGLRPTYGRVSRHGAMSLCWSWDKVGALARNVADCGLILSVINGGDARDWGSIDLPFGFDWSAQLKTVRVGYVPAFFEGVGATDVDRRALAAMRDLGVQLVEVSFPDLPLASLNQLVTLEAAAAFAELTLSNRDDTLKWQDDAAWPNSWRRAHLFPAVEMVQLERLRRRAMQAFDALFDQVDALIGPNYAGAALVATNATGHPSLAVKAGFMDAPTRGLRDEPIDPAGPKHRVPRTVSLWSRLFREDVLITLGRALEQKLGVADEHPELARL